MVYFGPFLSENQFEVEMSFAHPLQPPSGSRTGSFGILPQRCKAMAGSIGGSKCWVKVLEMGPQW